MPQAESPSPSPLLREWLDRIRESAALGPVLDLACGKGRHTIPLAESGLDVIALDRNPDFLAILRERAAAARERVHGLRADLETGRGIPLRPGCCGTILVFRFLSRPLLPSIAEVLAPGGLLLYETFTTGQRAHGWGPTRDEFLLAPGELPRLFPTLELLHHDEQPTAAPRTEASARLVARKP